jgi:hypothetical protein
VGVQRRSDITEPVARLNGRDARWIHGYFLEIAHVHNDGAVMVAAEAICDVAVLKPKY